MSGSHSRNNTQEVRDASAELVGAFERLMRALVAETKAEPPAQPSVPLPGKTEAPSAFLKTAEAAKLLNVASATLESWRGKGKGPPVTRLHNATRYERVALLKWIAENTKGAAK